MTSTDIEQKAASALKQVKKASVPVERAADNAVTVASDALHRVSHDLQKAASVIANRTQELVNRENVEKVWNETRAMVRRHPVQTALITTGVVALAAGAIFAMTRRPSRGFFT